MTGIAMFEKKADKDLLLANRYFKSDYIGIHLIRSLLVYTVTCLICVGLWLLYSLEDIMDTMELESLLETAKHIGFYYVIGLILYLLITRSVFSRRYNAASKSLKSYQARLRRLEKKYEDQQGTKGKEGVRRR